MELSIKSNLIVIHIVLLFPFSLLIALNGWRIKAAVNHIMKIDIYGAVHFDEDINRLKYDNRTHFHFVFIGFQLRKNLWIVFRFIYLWRKKIRLPFFSIISKCFFLSIFYLLGQQTTFPWFWHHFSIYI